MCNLCDANLLNNVYAYFDWDEQGGRLDWFKTYTSTVNNLLQHLAYDYDNLGNIENLYDYKTGNPQTQSFTYDSLNRLTSAQATGGTIGNYAQQSYTYDASTGNLASKAGVSYGYNDAAHTHAVTHLGGVQKYWYDANGNQTKRIIGADTYDLAYDAENRLVEVKKNSSVYAAFVYNADGQRVKGSVNGVSIAYVGSYAEWSNSALTSYYYAGAAQIAMRQAGELIYMFGDHLGSTSKTYKVSNGETKMQLYTPWGERRYPTAASEISTRYRYTGQYEYSELGLYFYQSRWYDAALGRFAQADTIVPLASQGVQALDRYAYVNNSPVNFVDPTGHTSACGNPYSDPSCRSLEKSPPIVIFETEGDAYWADAEKEAVLRETQAAAEAYAEVVNGLPWYIIEAAGYGGEPLTPEQAFLLIHGGAVTFVRSFQQHKYAGLTTSKNKITFYNVITKNGTINKNYVATHSRIVLHELGHAFNIATGRRAQSGLAGLVRTEYKENIDGYTNPFYFGFAGGWEQWQFGGIYEGAFENCSETFADMYIGWVYQMWDYLHPNDMGFRRENHMLQKMTNLIADLVQ